MYGCEWTVASSHSVGLESPMPIMFLSRMSASCGFRGGAGHDFDRLDDKVALCLVSGVEDLVGLSNSRGSGQLLENLGTVGG